MDRKSLKFIIKTDRVLNQNALDYIERGIKAFKNGESDVLIFCNVVTIDVFDENNNYITTI